MELLILLNSKYPRLTLGKHLVAEPLRAIFCSRMASKRCSDDLQLSVGEDMTRCKFRRVTITDEEPSEHITDAQKKLNHCLELRDKWMGFYYTVNYSVDRAFNASGVSFSFVDGVCSVAATGDLSPSEVIKIVDNKNVPSFQSFVEDYQLIRKMIYTGNVKTYCHSRLSLLTAKFNLHTMLNAEKELAAQKAVSHRDIYNVYKIDTHVHHSCCMNQKHLLKFIKRKLRHHSDDVVTYQNGQPMNLGEVFESYKLTPYDLSLDTMDMHAHDVFERFDKFNQKFSPMGQNLLREIFLKTDNAINGRYLAEITKEVLAELESQKYTIVEWRISIYGRKASEWATLAQWFYQHRLAHKNVRWLVQVPRLYHVYKTTQQIACFGDMLRNLFAPLFEATLGVAPKDPALEYFLGAVVGFDSVDDESIPEMELLNARMPAPEAYTEPHNPPYAYWMYYMYANLCVLNQQRAVRGLNSFAFRPHSGEAGDVDHLISTFLLAHHINHGILLRKQAALQYLYYLSQIGVAVSPLCNSKIFLDCKRNPFHKFFQTGLNVSLSTDGPLMLHYSKDALLEEYSTASQLWNLKSVDLCEIARNSVLQSGVDEEQKKVFLGPHLNDPRCSNVPEIRLVYRQEALQGELKLLNRVE